MAKDLLLEDKLLATGLPAYLSYLAAKEDAKKPGPEIQVNT